MNLVSKVGAKARIEKLLPLRFDKNDEDEAKKYFREREIMPKDFVVAIAPGAAESASSRRWLKERYAKFADTLLDAYAKKRIKIIFVGVSDERAAIDEIMTMMSHKDNISNAAGLLTLRQTFCIIKKCKAFVGNDSGPMHIAAAQGVKTLGLFGPNTPVRFGPFGTGNAAVYLKDSCRYSPCINVHLGQVPDCLYKKNSSDYQKCMRAISVDTAMLAFTKIVNK
jgi:heptosyltransferase-2